MPEAVDKLRLDARTALVKSGQATATISGAEGEPAVVEVGPGGTPSERAQVIATVTAEPLAELWVDDPLDSDDQAITDAGLVKSRDMFQLRRQLPAEDPEPVVTRPFRPGEDDLEWIGVNARAFAHHREQGKWTLDDLRSRMDEPWFDTEGFLVHEAPDGSIDGFCWTKIHSDESPPIGEIFVIGTDPSHQNKGLGRKLLLTGLDWLHSRGLDRVMLYVDADNEPALAMYRRAGFGRHQIRRLYLRRPGD